VLEKSKLHTTRTVTKVLLGRVFDVAEKPLIILFNPFISQVKNFRNLPNENSSDLEYLELISISEIHIWNIKHSHYSV
jgi:hypothetical protein